MKNALIMVGLPNSGKSTLVKQFVREELADGRIWSTVSRDIIREYMHPGKYVFDPKKEKEVTRIFNSTLENRIATGVNIVIDNTNLLETYIDAYIKAFEEAGYHIGICECKCPMWLLYLRNIWRRITKNKWIPIKVIKKMHWDSKKLNRAKYSKYWIK